MSSDDILSYHSTRQKTVRAKDEDKQPQFYLQRFSYIMLLNEIKG